jgi:hypothetical protein
MDDSGRRDHRQWSICLPKPAHWNLNTVVDDGYLVDSIHYC